MNAHFPVVLLTAALGLASAAIAQDEKLTGEQEKPRAIRTLERRPGGKTVEITHSLDGTKTERNLSPKDIKKLKRSGAMDRVDGRAYCRAKASTSPRRLAPGQTGELRVVVTLSRRGHAVVLPGSFARLTLKNEGGPLIFGVPRLDPAKPGRLETKYVGTPVYDDNLVFRVPVSVQTGAALKKYTVQGHVELEFHQAERGHPLGRLKTPVQGVVRVGAPMPNPAIAQSARGDRPADGPGDTVPAVDSNKSGDTVPATAPGSGDRAVTSANPEGEGGLRAPVAEDVPGTEVDTGADTEPGEGFPDGSGTSILNLVVGGGFVLILVLLLARRTGAGPR